MSKDFSIGKRIKVLRQAAGLSQRQLAERIKVNYSNIAYWENSGTPPRGEVIPALARELNISADELLGLQTLQSKKTTSPGGKLGTVIERISKMPRRRQQRIIETIETLLVGEEAKTI